MYAIRLTREGTYTYKVTSGNFTLRVELPKEGKAASGASPPDLLLASLGSCLAVYLERYLTGGKIPFSDFSIIVKSEICAEPPRHLKDIDVHIEVPGLALDVRRKKALLEFIENCPVRTTLTHEPRVSIVLKSD